MTVGSSKTSTAISMSSGNPLNTIWPSDRNADVGQGQISSGEEEAREGSSSLSSPPGSVFTDDPLLPKSLLSPMDHKLIKVSGNTIHDNDGSHLAGGISDDDKWQQYWTTLITLLSQCSNVPPRAVGSDPATKAQSEDL
eukprot:14742685-Ditylum_brightwellii.AAC.1